MGEERDPAHFFLWIMFALMSSLSAFSPKQAMCKGMIGESRLKFSWILAFLALGQLTVQMPGPQGQELDALQV